MNFKRDVTLAPSRITATGWRWCQRERHRWRWRPSDPDWRFHSTPRRRLIGGTLSRDPGTAGWPEWWRSARLLWTARAALRRPLWDVATANRLLARSAAQPYDSCTASRWGCPADLASCLASRAEGDMKIPSSEDEKEEEEVGESPRPLLERSRSGRSPCLCRAGGSSGGTAWGCWRRPAPLPLSTRSTWTPSAGTQSSEVWRQRHLQRHGQWPRRSYRRGWSRTRPLRRLRRTAWARRPLPERLRHIRFRPCAAHAPSSWGSRPAPATCCRCRGRWCRPRRRSPDTVPAGPRPDSRRSPSWGSPLGFGGSAKGSSSAAARVVSASQPLPAFAGASPLGGAVTRLSRAAPAPVPRSPSSRGQQPRGERGWSACSLCRWRRGSRCRRSESVHPRVRCSSVPPFSLSFSWSLSW